MLNHAVFKRLYLGTGSIERQTDRVVDTDRLGGLLSIWPWTGLTFLIGAVAIAGFPPFNGFVSEWLTLQALLKGTQEPAPGSLMGDLALVAGTMGLFVAFALTAFCFVKIAGLALLGMPRAKPEVVAAWRQKGRADLHAEHDGVACCALPAAWAVSWGHPPAENVSATTG
ncbi:MAG: hypothetical protein IPK16_27465 [Anaerolineales bacterium]|nr:hypothetical protein [Anaerolineales bacterium]